MKQAELRYLASQGDPQASEVLLNQALSHKAIQVNVELDPSKPDTLNITLLANPLPDAATSQVLITRELLAWPHIPFTTLMLSATTNALADTPGELVWQQKLDLSNPVTLQGLAQLRRSPPPVSVVPQAKHSPLPPQAWEIAVSAMDPQAQRAVAIGFGLALVLLIIEPLNFLLSPLVILVHELGHAATAWSFGYPAIPAFDFLYGGGVTMHGERISVLLWLIYGGIFFGAWWYRHNRLTLGIVGGFTLFYTWFAFSSIHDALFLAMGHGFELIFAGIFLYRALSGSGCRHGLEQTLYGLAGCFIIGYDLRFAWDLMFDPVAQGIYLEGKGGLLDNDFTRLGRFFGVDMTVVAGIFWWLVLLTPFVVYGLFRYRQVMFLAFSRVFLLRSDQHLTHI